MTYSEFKIALMDLNLNIKDFSQLVGMNPNSITNYKKMGSVPLSFGIMVNLMLELKRNNLDFFNVIEKSKREHSLRIASVEPSVNE